MKGKNQLFLWLGGFHHNCCKGGDCSREGDWVQLTDQDQGFPQVAKGQLVPEAFYLQTFLMVKRCKIKPFFPI